MDPKDAERKEARELVALFNRDCEIQYRRSLTAARKARCTIDDWKLPDVSSVAELKNALLERSINTKFKHCIVDITAFLEAYRDDIDKNKIAFEYVEISKWYALYPPNSEGIL